MVFDRFFGKSKGKSKQRKLSGREKRRADYLGSRLHTEPLEDRTVEPDGRAAHSDLRLNQEIASHSAAVVPVIANLESIVAPQNTSGETSATATATHYLISIPAGVTAGTPVTVQLIAEDANNHPVSSYDGIADLASSDTDANVAGERDLLARPRSFQITFVGTTSQTVTATDESDSTIASSADHLRNDARHGYALRGDHVTERQPIVSGDGPRHCRRR